MPGFCPHSDTCRRRCSGASDGG